MGGLNHVDGAMPTWYVCIMSGAPWTFRASLKHLDVEEPIDRWLHRPLAYVLIKPLEHHGRAISPTHVTLLSMIVGVGGGTLCSLASTRGPELCWLGGILVAFSVLLDCADGQLARLRGGGTRFGRALDGAADIVVGFTVWAGLSRYVASDVDRWWTWPLCVAILVSIIVHVGLYDQFKRKYLRLTQAESVCLDQSDGSSTVERWIETVGDGLYAGIFARLAGELVVVDGDERAVRARFYRPMRMTTVLGLGTNFFVVYSLAIALAWRPQWLLATTAIAIVGVMNVWTALTLVCWRRASQSSP